MNDRSPTASIAFDAEALLAFFQGEEGAKRVQTILDDVAQGTRRGYLNEVNAAELRYIVARRSGMTVADDCLDWLRAEARVQMLSSEETWQKAAAIKAGNALSLGDAFALATAQMKDCPLVAGADPELDVGPTLGIVVQRIRG